tara:strand:+ start:339 stop:599 length:261 start_codon:yes stop_codon:yes gene_type:complete
MILPITIEKSFISYGYEEDTESKYDFDYIKKKNETVSIYLNYDEEINKWKCSVPLKNCDSNYVLYYDNVKDANSYFAYLINNNLLE